MLHQHVHLVAAQGGLALGLGDVLGLALKTNADTLLRQQQVIFAEGQVLQARGQFDALRGDPQVAVVRQGETDELLKFRVGEVVLPFRHLNGEG